MFGNGTKLWPGEPPIHEVGSTHNQDEMSDCLADFPENGIFSRQNTVFIQITALLMLGLFPLSIFSQSFSVPRLSQSPSIDGDLQDWKEQAFTDGLWDIFRVRTSPWYAPSRNRLTDHGNEPSPEQDLNARYYLAWEDSCLYFGAEVHDNYNDVLDPRHAPKRWYYKDAIAFFLEIPQDTLSESFGAGDHGFAFVIDSTYPDYGAWWRRGTPDTNFLETPLPSTAVQYKLRFNPWGQSPADYILEARISLSPLLHPSDPIAHLPRVGDQYGFMIVHCDPDGGAYGGHLLLYGQGDDDVSWSTIQLVDSLPTIQRKDH